MDAHTLVWGASFLLLGVALVVYTGTVISSVLSHRQYRLGCQRKLAIQTIILSLINRSPDLLDYTRNPFQSFTCYEAAEVILSLMNTISGTTKTQFFFYLEDVGFITQLRQCLTEEHQTPFILVGLHFLSEAYSGQQDVELITGYLSSPHYVIWVTACFALAKYDQTQVFLRVIEVFCSHKDLSWVFIAKAMSLSKESVRDLAVPLSTHSDPRIRQAILAVFRDFSTDGTKGILLDCLSQESCDYVKTEAMKTVLHLHLLLPESVLREVLQCEFKPLTLLVVEYLARYPSPEFNSYLMTLLEHPDWEVTYHAVGAILGHGNMGQLLLETYANTHHTRGALSVRSILNERRMHG